MDSEAREIKPHAEPISAADLREGEVYFAVTYVDNDMLTPVMETQVFIGRNLEPDDIGQAYFQDVESYQEGVPYSWNAEDKGSARFLCGSEADLNHIFKFEQALDELLRCSIRRLDAAR